MTPLGSLRFAVRLGLGTIHAGRDLHRFECSGDDLLDLIHERLVALRQLAAPSFPPPGPLRRFPGVDLAVPPELYRLSAAVVLQLASPAGTLALSLDDLTSPDLTSGQAPG
jgi:hypothetical protein